MEATGSCEILFTIYNIAEFYNRKSHYLTFNIQSFKHDRQGYIKDSNWRVPAFSKRILLLLCAYILILIYFCVIKYLRW
jgi:hypothetical protein